MISGRIRLGCICCAREDFDGIDEIPDDWEDIDEVQSFEESIQEVDPNDPDGDVTFWETHMGVCPDCQDRHGKSVPGQGQRRDRGHQMLKTADAAVNEGVVVRCSATCGELVANRQ